jgi:hypothetical protein
VPSLVLTCRELIRMPAKPSPPEEPGRIIPFAQRRTTSRLQRTAPAPLSHPLEDELISPPDAEEERKDYRHRMKTNAVTLVVVVLLIWGGLWLADTLAQMRKNQDCVLSGRLNCTPVTVPDRVP